MTSICVHMCVLYALCVYVCVCVCVYMCMFMHVYIQGHSCKLAARYSLDNAMITHMYVAIILCKMANVVTEFVV